MAGRVMLFRPKYRSRLKHPVKDAYHGLLIKLRALGQLRLFAEIFKFEMCIRDR